MTYGELTDGLDMTFDAAPWHSQGIPCSVAMEQGADIPGFVFSGRDSRMLGAYGKRDGAWAVRMRPDLPCAFPATPAAFPTAAAARAWALDAATAYASA